MPRIYLPGVYEILRSMSYSNIILYTFYINNVQLFTTTSKKKILVKNRKCDREIRKSVVVLLMGEQGNIIGRKYTYAYVKPQLL